MSNLKVNTIEAAAGSSIVTNSYIKCNLPPAAINDLVNKQYVDASISSIPTTSTFYVDSQNQLYATQADAKYVNKADNVSETILGVKTFNSTPKMGVNAATISPEDVANKTYVDQQSASTLSTANSYTNSQVATALLNSTNFSKISIPQAVTGPNALYTDPVNGLVARDFYFMYANDSNYFTLEGVNGLTITGSVQEETFNKITGEVNGVATVETVTETVNRVRIDANSLGHSQVWTNVTASRISGTQYTNTTTKPIMVMVRPNINSAGVTCTITIVVGGTTIYSNNYSSEPPSFVVPVGSTYSITVSGSTTTFASWVELR